MEKEEKLSLKELKEKAKKEYDNKNHDKALELYKKLFKDYPEKINKWDKIFYSWSLYYVFVKNGFYDEKLCSTVELITELTHQRDLSKNDGACAYTLSVKKIIKLANENNDFGDVIYWTSKLNPELLSSDTFSYVDNRGEERIVASKKEEWYSNRTKALLKTEKFEECIQLSEEALEILPEFHHDNNVWFKWRIALSNSGCGNYEKSNQILKEILLFKSEWYVKKEIAENYHRLGQFDKSLKFAADAALSFGDIDKKINLYGLLEELLNEKKDFEHANLHTQLIYQIRVKNEWAADEDVEKLKKLNIHTNEETNPKGLEKKLKNFWEKLKFEGEERISGTVTKIFPHGKSGFISDFNNNSYFFNKFNFKDNFKLLKEGLNVSFFIEDSFDKKKNKKTKQAVNIIPL